MKTTLNNYTIDDFLKLKPTIYKYCVNLTNKRTQTSWFRDLSDADDLYQEVFLYVHDKYFNKPKEFMTYGKFTQIMKNCTYWAYYYRTVKSNFKVHKDVDYFEDSIFNQNWLDTVMVQQPEIFTNLVEHPDFEYYTRSLKHNEKKAVKLFLEGYTKTEVAKMCNKTYYYIPGIINKVVRNSVEKKKLITPIKPVRNKFKTYELDDIEFLKRKVPNFDKVLKKPTHVKLYSLYLQGESYKNLAKNRRTSVLVIAQQIYRINKKLKEYGNN